jgi:hypothetical protein
VGSGGDSVRVFEARLEPGKIEMIVERFAVIWCL